jgi:L1 cell adhesion molecule like protein
LGYGHKKGDGGVKGYHWVEEYMPNGSLDKIIRGMFLLKFSS